jgi:hypothetical protein
MDKIYTTLTLGKDIVEIVTRLRLAERPSSDTGQLILLTSGTVKE